MVKEPVPNSNQAVHSSLGSRYTYLSAADYCNYLGIDCTIEINALHELESLLRSPLPAGWTCESTASNHSCGPGIPYFVNVSLQLTQWEHPDESIHVLTISKMLVSVPKKDSKIWASWKRHGLLKKHIAVKDRDRIRPVALCSSRATHDIDCIDVCNVKTFAKYFNVNVHNDFDKLWILFLAANCPTPVGWETVAVENGKQIFLKSDLSMCSWEHPCDVFFELLMDKSTKILFYHTPIDGSRDTPYFVAYCDTFEFEYDWMSDCALTSEGFRTFLDDKFLRYRPNPGNAEDVPGLAEILREVLNTGLGSLANTTIESQRIEIAKYCGCLESILMNPTILHALQDIMVSRLLSVDNQMILRNLIDAAYSRADQTIAGLYQLLVSVMDINTMRCMLKLSEVCQLVLELLQCFNNSLNHIDFIVLWYMQTWYVSEKLMDIAVVGVFSERNSNILNAFLDTIDKIFICDSKKDSWVIRMHPRRRMINILRTIRCHPESMVQTALSEDSLSKMEYFQAWHMDMESDTLQLIVDAYPPGAYIATEATLESLPTNKLVRLNYILTQMTNRINDLLLEDLQERDLVHGEVATKEASIYLMGHPKY